MCLLFQKKWGSQRSSTQGTPLGQQSKDDKAEKKRREKEEKERKKKGGKAAAAPARLSVQGPGASGTLGAMGAAPLLYDDADDVERPGTGGPHRENSPDVQVQLQVRAPPPVQTVPVPAVSYPQGPRITIRPRADPNESGRASRASSEVRVDRAPSVQPPPPPAPPLPSRFATVQDGAYNTIVELPPAAGAGVALEPRFRALPPMAAEQQLDPPQDQMPAGDEAQEEEEEEQQQQQGTDSEGEADAEGDAQLGASFPPPPPRGQVHLYTHVRLQPTEPYDNLREYSVGYPPGGVGYQQQQQQQFGGEDEQQMEEAEGGEGEVDGASGTYDDGIPDGDDGGLAPEQQPQPPLQPMSHYPPQTYNYNYQPQRAHEDDAV